MHKVDPLIGPAMYQVGNTQRPHDAFHYILVFVQFHIIHNVKELCEQVVEGWFQLRSTNLRYFSVVQSVYFVSQYLLNSCIFWVEHENKVSIVEA